MVDCDENDAFRLSYTQFVSTTMSPDSLKKKNKRLQDEEKLRKPDNFNSCLNTTDATIYTTIVKENSILLTVNIYIFTNTVNRN